MLVVGCRVANVMPGSSGATEAELNGNKANGEGYSKSVE